MKKFLSFLLTFVMLFSLTMPAMAAEGDTYTLYIDIGQVVDNTKEVSGVWLYAYGGAANVYNEQMTHVSGTVYSYPVPSDTVDGSVEVWYTDETHFAYVYEAESSSKNLYTPTGQDTGTWSTYGSAGGITGGTTGEVSASYTPTATITGVSLIVDGVEHSSGLVTLTSANTVQLKVYGTNLNYGTTSNIVEYKLNGNVPVSSGYGWAFSDDGTSATRSVDVSDFRNLTSEYTLQYTNDGQSTWNNSSVSVIYSNSEDAAITGVSITVDGNTYTSGNVTIYSDSEVTVTVAGSKLNNATDDHAVKYRVDDTWYGSEMTASDDGTYATLEGYGNGFSGCENFEILYCNDWLSSETWQNTGIYLTYNEGTKPTYYSITVSDSDNGTVKASKSAAAEGDSITLTVTPAEGYQLGKLTVTNAATSEVTDITDSKTFEMPGSDVTVKAVFEKIPHAITIDENIANGTVIADLDFAVEGSTVTLTVTPGTGYQIKTVTVRDAGGNTVDFDETGVASGTYTFKMPASAVTVTATFEAIPITSAEITWGSMSFTAQAAYASYDGYESITGSFDPASKELAIGENYTFTLKLSGKPAKVLSGDKIGKVTITINEAAEG